MKLPYSWFSELIDGLPSPEQVAEDLVMLGFEVEEVELQGEGLQDVVVGKILERNQHPNADKLSLCKVTDGSETHDIVCGASNMQAGDLVALARVGSVLPGDFKIEKRKIRGEASSGMLCSKRELQLGEDHAGIMILPESYEIGNKLVDEMGLNDAVYDISVTPNRPDVLSAIGMARELAAKYKATVQLPDMEPIAAQVDAGTSPKIEIADEDLCYRYAGLIIKNIKIGSSPDWIKNRLEACGVRSINNVVDATNYVLLETGQPLHAFDLDKLLEQRIVVRRAKPGEKMKTLDEEERTLDDSILVIADAKDPAAIGGVMGGFDSEVSESTTSLLLESAYFYSTSIHKTSKALKLSTEASFRFERGVDFDMVVPAAWRCAHLIAELAGGQIAGDITTADTKNQADISSLQGHEMILQLEYCNRLLGKDISTDEIEDIFNGLGITVQKKTGDAITVGIPSYRNDIQYQADLVEEVARCHGYNSFEPSLPLSPTKPAEKQEIDRALCYRIRDYLADCGLDDCVTYSFMDETSLAPFTDNLAWLEEPVMNLANPLSPRETIMRTSMIPSLLLAAQRNASRGLQDFGLFELARKYIPENGDHKDKNPCLEYHCAAGLLLGNPHKHWRMQRGESDYFEGKGIVEGIMNLAGIKRYRPREAPKWMHPSRSSSIQAGKGIMGYYGELHPAVAEQFELTGRITVFELDLQPLSQAAANYIPQCKPFSIYPATKRDLALLVPDQTQSSDIETIIRKESENLLEDLTVFDYYRGKQVEKGFVSQGYRITFRSDEGTLKDETIDTICSRILDRLSNELGVQIRS